LEGGGGWFLLGLRPFGCLGRLSAVLWVGKGVSCVGNLVGGVVGGGRFFFFGGVWVVVPYVLFFFVSFFVSFLFFLRLVCLFFCGYFFGLGFRNGSSARNAPFGLFLLF